MNTPDIMFYANKKVVDATDNLPESEWNKKGVCGEWSVKDIVAHIVSYELIINDVLSTFTNSTVNTPYLDRMKKNHDVFNAEEVNGRKNLTVKQVTDEYKNTYEKNMKLLSMIPKEKLSEVGTIPWYGENYCLDDFIVYMVHGHKVEHSTQIALFKDNLNK